MLFSFVQNWNAWMLYFIFQSCIPVSHHVQPNNRESVETRSEEEEPSLTDMHAPPPPPLQALKFQGRLKYLHGQSMMGEDGSRVQSQLALFSIAVPVQTPSILEIRTKTLIFQTKHQLDFTPMGIDNR